VVPAVQSVYSRLQKSCNKDLIVQNHSWTIYTSFLHDFIGDNYIVALSILLQDFAICCNNQCNNQCNMED